MRATLSNIEKHWSNCPPELMRSNQSSLNYIRDVAARTGTNIARWNLVAVFGSGQDANLKTDHNEINRLFFAKMGNGEGNDEQDVVVSLDPLLRNSLKSWSDRILNDQRAQLESQVRSHTDNARMNYTRYENDLRTAARFMQQLENIRPSEATTQRLAKVEKELEEVLNGDFWCDPIVTDNFLWLRTASDLIITERRRSAGIDMQFNAGLLAVRWNITGTELRVFPYKRNKRHRELYHPHVDRAGVVCWGDAAQLAAQHLQNWNVKDLLLILQSLLVNYNAAAPYIQLNDLIAHGTPMRASTGSLRTAYHDRDAEKRMRREDEPDPSEDSIPDEPADPDDI